MAKPTWNVGRMIAHGVLQSTLSVPYPSRGMSTWTHDSNSLIQNGWRLARNTVLTSQPQQQQQVLDYVAVVPEYMIRFHKFCPGSVTFLVTDG